MPRSKMSPYSRFLTLFRRGYSRDHIVRIMHIEGYTAKKADIREWFKNAPESVKKERHETIKLERAKTKKGEKPITEKDRYFGFLYRLQSRLDPDAVRQVYMWLDEYRERSEE